MKLFILSIMLLGTALATDGAHQRAEAPNLVGPLFTPHLYGKRPPRADNAWVRSRTVPL
jgi:hypothetical protein